MQDVLYHFEGGKGAVVPKVLFRAPKPNFWGVFPPKGG